VATSYTVLLSRRADKALDELAKHSPKDCAAVEDAIEQMAQDWRLGDVKKLRGRDGYRRRVRNYRILFRVDTKQAIIHIDDVDLHHRVY
jgi:mRNA interferase RelE/StbE